MNCGADSCGNEARSFVLYGHWHGVFAPLSRATGFPKVFSVCDDQTGFTDACRSFRNIRILFDGLYTTRKTCSTKRKRPLFESIYRIEPAWG